MEIKHLSAVLSPTPDTVCKQETVSGGLSSYGSTEDLEAYFKKLTLTNCTGENDHKPNDLTPVVLKVSPRFGPASPYVRW